jgi:hypothetical protein
MPDLGCLPACPLVRMAVSVRKHRWIETVVSGLPTMAWSVGGDGHPAAWEGLMTAGGPEDPAEAGCGSAGGGIAGARRVPLGQSTNWFEGMHEQVVESLA